MSKKRIQKNLARALLQGVGFAEALYEYELAEHVDEYFQSKKQDGDLFFFAVTEHSGDVAMLLIDKDDVLHINEDARQWLLDYWPDTYVYNIERILPTIADQLDQGFLFSVGVKEVDENKRGNWINRLLPGRGGR
jgi:hypothetical protein